MPLRVVAYCKWSQSSVYPTLPVQAIDRIVTTEEEDSIHDEENVGIAEEQAAPSDEGVLAVQWPIH